jgi:hypothetical protein
MPAEAFDVWLSPHIEAYGSPAPGGAPSLADPRWLKELRGRPLSFWSAVRWRKVEAPLAELPLERRARRLAEELATRFIEFESSGKWSSTGVTDSLQRLSQLVFYLRSNGALPKPMVCLACSGEWLLLDGQHRLAAASVAAPSIAGLVLVWLGENGI